MKSTKPFIRPLATESEIRRQTDEILGDANDETIKTYINHIQNFMDADSEAAYHLASTAQKHAFTKTLAFDDAFRRFAEFPEGDSFSPDQESALRRSAFDESEISDETH